MKSNHPLATKPQNKKMNEPNEEGENKLRISHTKAKGIQCPYFTVKCGCCNEKVVIDYDPEDKCAFGRTLEIGAVSASIKEWRKILIPLLELDEKLIDS